MRLREMPREGNAFFHPQDVPIVVDPPLIEDLLRELRFENSGIRICLHDGPAAPYHDMIIAASRGYDFPTHMHPAKEETIHVIRGTVLVFLWKDKLRSQGITLREGSLIRIPRTVYHSVSSYSPVSVYHESKLGPFTGRDDRVFAPWLAKHPDVVKEAAK